jgi:hypothetical protein
MTHGYHNVLGESRYQGYLLYEGGVIEVVLTDWFFGPADTGAHGTLSKTIEAATITANGKLNIAGAVSQSISDASLVSASKVNISGSLSKEFDGVTISGSGNLKIVGSASKTVDGITITAAGVHAILPSGGYLNATLGDVALFGNNFIFTPIDPKRVYVVIKRAVVAPVELDENNVLYIPSDNLVYAVPRCNYSYAIEKETLKVEVT